MQACQSILTKCMCKSTIHYFSDVGSCLTCEVFSTRLDVILSTTTRGRSLIGRIVKKLKTKTSMKETSPLLCIHINILPINAQKTKISQVNSLRLRYMLFTNNIFNGSILIQLVMYRQLFSCSFGVILFYFCSAFFIWNYLTACIPLCAFFKVRSRTPNIT